jgi:hypothetical protein
MIKKTLLGALKEKIIAAEELYNLDDQGLFALMEDRTPQGGPLFSLAPMVRDGKLYETAAEFPFDEGSHRKLGDITRRSELEENLAAELSRELGYPVPPEKIIIDVPEPVSFESGLFVSDEDRYFEESSSAFKKDLIGAFVRSLRIVRIFLEPALWENLKNTKTGSLQIKEKWVHSIERG